MTPWPSYVKIKSVLDLALVIWTLWIGRASKNICVKVIQAGRDREEYLFPVLKDLKLPRFPREITEVFCS